jgi:stage II sporulation protein D
LIYIKSEPAISVGLISGASAARVSLAGGFAAADGATIPEGDYTVRLADGRVVVEGDSHGEARSSTRLEGQSLVISPKDFAASRFTVHGVTIGIEFHWERKESQVFQGALKLLAAPEGLTVINELPLESYLVSVISSEMSATCPPELLRAHAIVSRSWLLAQLVGRGGGRRQDDELRLPRENSADEMIRWYDRENHAHFDVCADDHCQRYQGISKAFSDSSFDAIRDTRGKALVWGEEVCDARYSKSCGGMTELYGAAWEDKEVPYLASFYDWDTEPRGYGMPLTVEENAEGWIGSSPAAYCNNVSGELMARILPGFDQETEDFYRWEVVYSQEELSEIIRKKTGHDLGRIARLEAIERGQSGRLIRLKITGEKKTIVIGKELEIRRALSRSHLYSSAIIARGVGRGGGGFPEEFRLTGAGWGHGVGMCQIGAAVMAERGKSHEEILAHYFRGAEIRGLY